MSSIKIMNPSAAMVDTCEWSTNLEDEKIMSGFLKTLVLRIKKTVSTHLSGRAASLDMTTP